jgi:hypothetical protein
MNSSPFGLSGYPSVEETEKVAVNSLRVLPKHLFLILVLLWTPLILLQTWNVQHSCYPLTKVQTADSCFIQKVTVSPDELNFKVGDSQSIKAEVSLEKADHNIDQSLTWTSSNPKIVAVDTQGRITAIALGKAQITARSKVAVDQAAVAKITVFDPQISPQITKLTLQPKRLFEKG